MGVLTESIRILSTTEMAQEVQSSASKDMARALALAGSETTSIAEMGGRITDEGGGNALHTYLGDKFSLTGSTVTTEWNKDVVPGLTTAQANSNYNPNNGPDQTDFLKLHDIGEAQRLNDAYLQTHTSHDPPHAENRLAASYQPQQPAHLIRHYSCELGNLSGEFATDAVRSGAQASLQLYGNPKAVADVTIPAKETVVRSFVARSSDNAVQYTFDKRTAIFEPR